MVLRAGDTPTNVAERRGQYFDWIRREVGDAWDGPWAEHDVRTEAPFPDPRGGDAFIMTGSSSRVTEREPWMLRAEGFLRQIADSGAPFFGICFGHQMIAQALGGEVRQNPNGREIGTVDVRLVAGRADPLFEGVGTTFRANATHVETVAVLPPGAQVLAENERDPHQAYAIGAAIRCVQFHPEIDGDAMRSYVEGRAHLIDAEGGDAQAVLARVGDAPDAAETLRNFVRSVVRAR
jgi:GMP synthase (glutamine-hydrolysing)